MHIEELKRKFAFDVTFKDDFIALREVNRHVVRGGFSFVEDLQPVFAIAQLQECRP
ncbi:hypothetical protein [Pseudomonas syringae]|uniref:Uncharacterized protein n=2 Tax=Pseudomonas syringae TaxID=317 RepID=A0A3M4KGQ1_PSESF|nr:hypothetical protein [Pseudomonas syringae]RMQ28214.1 hypothetical protein ALQ07_00803 [Pseudomonas syringae pv. actinidiae]UYS79888.1 hypothetical protein A237_020800 [Pseudomonas syringae pv. actinidifoliorum ICMP 18803]